MKPLLVLVTIPGEQSAHLAQQIVESRLAACVNCLANVSSCYHWQGKVETSAESLLIIKTTSMALPQLETLVKKLHPYEVPEFIALHPEMVSDAYLKWWSTSCSATALGTKDVGQ